MENVVTFCFTLLVMLQMLVGVSMNLYNGLGGKFCCQGYKWDQDKCIACEIGFHGKKCEIKCHYPTYGRDCQPQCNCSVANCDHVKGCVRSLVDYQINPTLHSNYKTATEERIGTPNVTENPTANFNTPECDAKKTLYKRIHNLLYPVFGLTAVSVIIYMVYLYTRSLEKRLVKTNTV